MTITGFTAAITQALLEQADDRGLRLFIQEAEQEIIRRRGYTDGRSAGSWVFDGNMSTETVLVTQSGIKAGDPAVLDQLPQPRIGGEFADDPTWENILKEEVNWYIRDEEDDERDDLLQVYQDAFNQGVQDEVLAYGSHSVAS